MLSLDSNENKDVRLSASQGKKSSSNKFKDVENEINTNGA